MLKISVVTCTFNSEKTILKCINSVNKQIVNQQIEHLFIDGGSKDKTIEIIQTNSKQAIIYSEPDEGIYDAFNKGLKRATGDVIGFLHSDDEFFDSNGVSRIIDAFDKNPEIDYYCAKMACIDPKNGNVLDLFGSTPHFEAPHELFRRTNNYAHPTFYCRRQLIDKVGMYNKRYHVAADFDWILRLRNTPAKPFFDEKPLMKMYAMGASNKYLLKGLIEEYSIRKQYEGKLVVISLIYTVHLLKRTIKAALVRVKLDLLVSMGRYFFQHIIPDIKHKS